LNIPLKDGIDDHMYYYIFESAFDEINFAFKPDAIVVQCGADALANDPLGGFSLSPNGIGRCLQKILKLKLPSLLLGGGGYNLANAARFWTYLTGLVVTGEDLPSDIPDCDPFFSRYGPSFELTLSPGRRANLNTKEYVNDLLEEAFGKLYVIEAQLRLYSVNFADIDIGRCLFRYPDIFSVLDHGFDLNQVLQLPCHPGKVLRPDPDHCTVWFLKSSRM
jgi:hypothetical protein